MNTILQNTDKGSRDSNESHMKSIIYQFIKDNPIIIWIFIVWLIVIIFQDIVIPHVTGTLVNAIHKRQNLIKEFTFVVAVIIVIQVLYTYIDWQDMLLLPWLQGYIREKSLNTLFDVYSNHYAEIDSAGTLSKLLKLPYAVFSLVDQMRYFILPYVFVYATVIVYVSLYDIILGVIIFVTCLTVYLLVLYSPRLCEKVSWYTEYLTSVMANEFDDIFNNLISVYSQNQEKHEISRFKNLQKEYMQSQYATVKCTFAVKALLFPVMIVFFCLFTYRSYTLILKKKIDTGTFVALFFIMQYLANSLWRLINQVREAVPRWGRLKECLTIFDNKDVKQHNVVPILEANDTYTDIKNGILLKNVSFTFENAKTPTLINVTINIPQNQKVAIIGRIGSGKSTLLKLIMKYYLPSSGSLSWNGINYNDISTSNMRNIVGYVHQNPTLFNRSIYENIVYGLTSKVSKDDITILLERMGLAPIFANVPGYLDANVGKKGSKLSGGQRQLVWLLRIMFKNPQILILDEPTASIDDVTKGAIESVLKVIMQNKTVIIVTHDKFLLRSVDRVIIFGDGQVVDDYQPKEDKYMYK